MTTSEINEIYSIIDNLNNKEPGEQIEELCSYVEGEESVELLYVYQYDILKALINYTQYIHNLDILELIRKVNYKEYMEEVAKECDDLKLLRYYRDYRIMDDKNELVIGRGGDCNYDAWNKRWLRKNIQEFNDTHILYQINVQELFPNPKDFVKFYEKVCKEIK